MLHAPTTAADGVDNDAATTTTTAAADDGPFQLPGAEPPVVSPNAASIDGPSAQADAAATAGPPPFWSRRHASTQSESAASLQSADDTPQRPQILLEDRSDDHHEQSRACWARSVTIDEHVVVSGPTGVGAYVVWHCTVSTLKGGKFHLRKRYSEFDRLHDELVRSFPYAGPMIPELPRKSVVSRFRPKFLEQRKHGLEHFLKRVSPSAFAVANHRLGA